MKKSSGETDVNVKEAVVIFRYGAAGICGQLEGGFRVFYCTPFVNAIERVLVVDAPKIQDFLKGVKHCKPLSGEREKLTFALCTGDPEGNRFVRDPLVVDIEIRDLVAEVHRPLDVLLDLESDGLAAIVRVFDLLRERVARRTKQRHGEHQQ
ncbi:ZPR1 zinc finger domain protein [Babesia caballi]|uniref:ZPR1 zinc finger domain protein n=1 Tax=Babesia caballi TaxID=5871 RepID=A0AAV4LUS6_BABCB|nr:ZPR1 zinc finger domain protein [Babesia caballi]